MAITPKVPGLAQRVKRLRRSILASLRKQGYRTVGGTIQSIQDLTKDNIREMHKLAVSHRREKARISLERQESELLEFIANGDEVDPFQVQPRLVLVKPRTRHELLFRYAAIHWSIPVSSGYGRRLRFLVIDDQNGKHVG
jgi:hypothetical protein